MEDSVLAQVLPILGILLMVGVVFLLHVGGASLQQTVEDALRWVGGKVKQNLTDYVDVETIDDEKTWVLRDGSLMTLVKVHGTYQLIGPEEFAAIDASIASNLNAYMKSGGHAAHFIYNEDDDSVERAIREKLRPAMETAARLNLDLDDLFEEDVKTMVKHATNEAVYIVLLTRPNAVSKQELKRNLSAKLELLNANPLPSMRDAPNLFSAIAALRTRHSSYVNQLISDLRTSRIDAEALDVHTASREMRSSADADFTAETWQARVFGDRIPHRISKVEGDISGALWPRLDSQLIPRDGVEVDLRTVEVGDRIYAPMYITLQPAEIKPFAVLFQRVRESKIPWRITFRVESGGLRAMSFKGIVGAIFGWTSKENSLISEAVNHVQAAVKDGTQLDVAYRVDFMTWAPKGQEALLRDRAARLARAVQGWGLAETSEVSGDVFEGFVSNCVGMRVSGLGPVSCAVLRDVTPMLPMYRPASPWRSGGLLFRTPDGKVYPYQPNSPVQSSWITLIYAEMRSGKSVLGNQINLALCLAPGIVRLPLIAIVDIGRASAGAISLLKHALPAHLQHLVTSIRLRMTPEFSINPLDTQLGSRFPLPHEKTFQKNLILTLVTPADKAAPEDGIGGLAEMAIDEAYKRSVKEAKRYEPGLPHTSQVDEAIARFGVEVDSKTTWWEIVDALFDHGDYHSASIAQRYAVPTLTDVSAIVSDPVFTDLYGKKALGDSEPIQDAFQRRISESIRSYPILNNPTRFDLGLARVVSIDLDEVAKAGNAQAKRQTAVVYMLSRHIAARNFFLHTDDVELFPERYREYQEKRISEIMQDKKHLQYDEFHVTDGVASVRDQVEADMRVTGKLGVAVTLISQSDADFTPRMLEFASCKIVLSRANKAVAERMKATFGLTDTTMHAIQHEIRPPSKDGSTFVGMFKTKASEADAVQLLRNTVGGIKLWGFSTTNEDAIVRDALYAKIGPAEARRFLAKVYPGGSVQDEIERRKNLMAKSAILEVNDKGEGVINELIAELIQTYEQTRREALAA